MDGADILIIKEFIGDFGRMDLEMDVENGYQQMEKSRKETGQWVLKLDSNGRFLFAINPTNQFGPNFSSTPKIANVLKEK